MDGHGDGDGAGAGAGTGVEVNEGAQDGNGDGAGTGTEERTVAEMGTGTTKTGMRIGLGRAEGRRKSARNRKIAVDAVRERERHGGKRKKCRKEKGWFSSCQPG